jgi:hypothetical protein
LWLVLLALLPPPDDDVLLEELLGETGELPPHAAAASADISMRAHTDSCMRDSPAKLVPAPARSQPGFRRRRLSSPAYASRPQRPPT